MRSAITIAALAFAAGAAYAQSHWAKEPERVFGLQLGSKLADSQIPNCRDADDPAREIKFCQWGGTGDATFVRGFPIPEFEDGIVMLVDDSAAGFVLSAKHADYLQVKSILLERYGPPTRRTIAKVRTKAGVPYDSETLNWTGKRVTLELEEYSRDINTSSATFHYLPLLGKRAEKDRADAKSKAPKM
jgi:hypothetical protein